MENVKLPDGWKIEKLGTLVDIKTGKLDANNGDDGGAYPFFTCASEPIKIDSYSFDEEAIILPGNGANVGLVMYYKGKFEAYQRTYVMTNFNGNLKYLYYYMKMYWKKYNDNKQYGSATNYIKIGNFTEFSVVVPTLENQEKVVKVLEKAEKTLEKRKETVKLLDELIKSQFIEMFGNPATNSKEWNKETIGSVVKSITAGWSANGEAREKREGEKAVLKVSAVTQGYFKADEYKVISDGVEIKKYVFPQKGDLLFSRANTREMVGATCIIHKDYPDLLLPDKLWKVLFADRVNVFYMKYILSEPSIRAEFSAKSTGTSGSMYNVSMDKFRNIEIPIPPIELQNKFAKFFNQVDKLKFEMQKSLEEMENNFNSLMQRAFKGELFSER